MLQLIKKDILFNWKWALLLVLVAVLMPVLFFIDREETRFILWVYIIGNVLANSHFVSKSCYMDDSAQTRRFLASLPVRRAQLVAAKYLLGFLCMVASLGLTSLSSFVLGLHPSVQGAMIAFLYLLLYYAVFLGVFFHSNYSNAEKTNTALLMLTIMSAFVMDRTGLRLDEMIIEPTYMLAGLGTCIMIFAASLFFSVRSFDRFQVGDSR